MSVHQQAPPFDEHSFPPSPIRLAAHTASATALTKRLFEDRISQENYDDQILATSINLITRIASIPIVMTMDDTLATILEHASRALGTTFENTERARLYLLCPKSVLEYLGIPAPVSGELALLDRDGLTKLLKFLQRGNGSDELVIACEDDLDAAEKVKKLMMRVEDQDDETRAMRNWRPTTSSGGSRARELWSEVGSSAEKFVQTQHRNAALRRARGISKDKRTT